MGFVLILLHLTIFNVGQAHCGFQSWPDASTSKPEEAFQKWRNLETETKNLLEKGLRQFLPYILRITEEVNISSACLGSLLKFVAGIRNLEDWAITMLDATGKPAGGQLMGTSSAFGSFDECLSIVHNERSLNSGKASLKGMYCVLDVRPPLPPLPRLSFLTRIVTGFRNYSTTSKVIENKKQLLGGLYLLGFKLGVCIPSLCNKTEVKELSRAALKQFEMSVTVKSCEVQGKVQIDAYQYTVIALLCGFATLVLIGTMCSAFNFSRQPITSRLLQCFSAISNTKQLFKTSSHGNADNPLSCLKGMRFFSTIWVILGHTWLLRDANLHREFALHLEILKSVPFQIILNSNLVVDSFFFITSVLVSYNLVSRFGVERKLNIPVVLTRRIWRFLPSEMLAVGLLVLLPVMGSGPSWNDIVKEQADNCRKNWWHVLLSINDFKHPFEMCLWHSWYISADLQMFVMALFLIFFYFRNPKWCKILLLLIITFSIGTHIFVIWYLEIIPAMLAITLDNKFMAESIYYMYTLPYTRTAVYAIGMYLGIYLATGKKSSISVQFRILGWSLAVICNLTVLLATYVWNAGFELPVGILPSIYGGLRGPIWSLGLVWITVLCFHGYGGLVNSFLSWNGFNPLNKLAYMVYLIHMLTILFQQGSLRGPVDSTHINLVWTFFGNLCVSYLLAFLLNLLFEAPLNNLESLLFEKIISKKSLPAVNRSTKPCQDNIPPSLSNENKTNNISSVNLQTKL